jgi:hypothetical protein
MPDLAHTQLLAPWSIFADAIPVSLSTRKWQADDSMPKVGTEFDFDVLGIIKIFRAFGQFPARVTSDDLEADQQVAG